MIGQKVINVIDIGSSNIIAALARIDRRGRIISLEIAESESKGIDKGLIIDLEKLTDSIQLTIRKLESKSKMKICDVYININSRYVTTRHSYAAIPLVDKTNRIITHTDIDKVNNQARLLGLKLEEKLIHEFSQSYTIDDYNKVRNPLGLYGRKLEVDLYMIVAKISQIDNLVKSVNQAGLEVVDIELSGLADSLALLEAREREYGCVLINIGAGVTEILIFKDDIVREIEILPFGGNDITHAIVSKLKIPFGLAEDLKKSYGLASSKDIEHDREVLIKQDSSYKPIQQKLICELIESELDRLISLIKAKIDSSTYREKMNSGVIITGGSVLLSGFLEKIESELKLPVRFGRVKNVNFASSKMPLYATAVGLVYYGINASINKYSKILGSKGFIFRFLNKVKEIYQEYF